MQSVYAQECPPSSTCTIPFTTQNYGLALDDNGNLNVTANISSRINCDGNLEVIVNNFQGGTSTNLDFMEELNIHHYNYSSASELVALDFIMHRSAFGQDSEVPLCGSSTITRVLVYTAACGIWTRCSYKLPSNVEKVCDTPWNGDDPDYSDGTDRWVDHWRWHSCGEVCCKKEYVLTMLGSRVIVQSVTKSRYSEGEECSLQGTFFGNRPLPTDPPVELPCEDGC